MDSNSGWFLLFKSAYVKQNDIRVKFMKKLILIIPALIFTGCSSNGYVKQQSELYQVSMAQYQDYSCNQVRAEMRRLASLIDQQTIAMQKPKEENNQYLETAIAAFAIAKGRNMSSNDGNSEESAVLLLGPLLL